MVSEQWFVKIAPLAEAAEEAVQDGRIQIIPEHFAKIYHNWMENIKDSCISRQLWWGHRIPVWYPRGRLQRQDVRPHRSAAVRPISGGSKNIHQDPDRAGYLVLLRPVALLHAGLARGNA